MNNGSSWWVTLVEGLVAIALGLYLLFGGTAAAGNVALVIALYILIVGIIELFRNKTSIGRYRGIIGVIVGGLILLLYAVDIFPPTWDFTIFAIGVIIVGGFGLFAEFFGRGGRNFAWGPVLVNGLMLLLGILILFYRDNLQTMQTITALILIAIGVIIALWGYSTRGRDDSEEDAADEDPVEKDTAEVDTSADDTSADDTSGEAS